MAVPIYTPINNEKYSIFFTSLLTCISCFLIIAVLTNARWYLIVFWFAFSWFLCSFVFNCFFFLIFVIELYEFFMHLDINLLSGRRFANIFCHYISFILFAFYCSLLLLLCFLVWCGPTYWFLLLLLMLKCHIQKTVAQKNIKKLFSYVYF